jgi:hypothetical protein
MARERWVFDLLPVRSPVPGLSNTLLCSIVSLVLGAQPGKVYNNLRIIASRMKERF